MVTYDAGTNGGFEFDVNFQLNDSSISFTAKEIKMKIRLAFDEVAPHFGYDHAEDFTRVITIKFKDRNNSRIIDSCDFAIVNDYTDNDGYDSIFTLSKISILGKNNHKGTIYCMKKLIGLRILRI